MTALPPLASGALPPQSATPTATLAILHAPAELNALPAGARIASAVVTAVDGTITLKTEFGTIVAQSAVALQKDALVSLLVQRAAPGMVLRVIQMGLPEGEQHRCPPVQGQPEACRREVEQVAAMPAATVAMVKPAGAAGIRIEAIVLTPSAGAAFTPAGGPVRTADVRPTVWFRLAASSST